VNFIETPIPGVWIVRSEPSWDERGYFVRTYSVEEFAARGLNPDIAQCSISYNAARWTLRGLHYQREPRQESKLVRCVQGRVFDVTVDLRPESPTYCQWFGMELTAGSPDSLFIPEGCAHGFLSLLSDTVMHYQISANYSPDHSVGVRWNDPAFAIEWPADPVVISPRDRDFADFTP